MQELGQPSLMKRTEEKYSLLNVCKYTNELRK
jgi:hypothetical protein